MSLLVFRGDVVLVFAFFATENDICTLFCHFVSPPKSKPFYYKDMFQSFQEGKKYFSDYEST